MYGVGSLSLHNFVIYIYIYRMHCNTITVIETFTLCIRTSESLNLLIACNLYWKKEAFVFYCTKGVCYCPFHRPPHFWLFNKLLRDVRPNYYKNSTKIAWRHYIKAHSLVTIVNTTTSTIEIFTCVYSYIVMMMIIIIIIIIIIKVFYSALSVLNVCSSASHKSQYHCSKARLKRQVFSPALNVTRESQRRRWTGRWFHSLGAA